MIDIMDISSWVRALHRPRICGLPSHIYTARFEGRLPVRFISHSASYGNTTTTLTPTPAARNSFHGSSQTSSHPTSPRHSHSSPTRIQLFQTSSPLPPLHLAQVKTQGQTSRQKRSVTSNPWCSAGNRTSPTEHSPCLSLSTRPSAEDLKVVRRAQARRKQSSGRRPGHTGTSQLATPT